MKRTRTMRWGFAAAAAAALVFGSAQAFAAPAAQKGAWCDPYQCATTGCPEGCGPGWCDRYGCNCYC